MIMKIPTPLFSTLYAHHRKTTTTENLMRTMPLCGAVGLSCHRDTKCLFQEQLDIVKFSNPLAVNTDPSIWLPCQLVVMIQTGRMDTET